MDNGKKENGGDRRERIRIKGEVTNISENIRKARLTCGQRQRNM